MNVKCSFLYDRYSKPIVNFSLRGLTMGCRFLLIIFLAKLFSPSEVGLFGLISATVVISQLLIGGEYYSYSQRELISMGKDRWSFVLQHQAVALLLLYMFFAPMLVGLFHWDVLPGYLMSFFYLILILESIAQELNRVMIAMQCQITASWILFCRHGLWVLCILPYIWVYPESRSLDLILGAWVIGCTIALLLALFMIKREVNPWKIWALDLGWVKRGFKVSLLYFAGALCFRAIFTIDRYAVESLLGLDFLGVYVVYIGLAMSIVTVLDPLIFSFAYPKLIRLITEKNHHGFKLAMVELAKSTLKTTLVAILLVSYLAPFIFVWIDKPFYTENLPMLWILQASAMGYGLSMVPHFGLYALKDDNSLLQAHVYSLVLFLTCLLILPYLISKEHVVGASLLVGFSFMGLIKTWFLKQHKLETSNI